MQSFESMDISAQVLENLKSINYQKPTAIQAEAIPVLLEKKDVVFQSQTGSGKTAAFGIPLIERVMRDVPAVQYVVLVPTRELANQVYQEMSRLAKGLEVKLTAIYGGTSIKRQEEALRAGAQIVVGTPGRILDHLKRRNMSFSIVRGIVLDEADKMLSMGFLPDVRLIFKHLPKRRQSVMSSATFPGAVEAIISQYMVDPVRISTSSDAVAAKDVKHYYCIVPNDLKNKTLLDFIEMENPELSLIFCNTRSDVKAVQHFLSEADLSVAMLSSDLNQRQREKTLNQLKTGKVQHLVCTDVAARGIDVPFLSHVFMYAASEDQETYVHRSGRTGRAGRAGKAISIISGQDVANHTRSMKINSIDSEEIKPPTEEDILSNRVAGHLESLRSIDFAADADVRDEFAELAKKLTPEQATWLLPFLLEKWLRPSPELVLVETDVPPMHDHESSAGEDEAAQEESRGRKEGRRRDQRDQRDQRERSGRDRSSRDRKGRDRDRDRDRGRRGDQGRGGRYEQHSDRLPDDTEPSKEWVKVCLALGTGDNVAEKDIVDILSRQGKARRIDIGSIEMQAHETYVEIGKISLKNVLRADGRHYKGFELFVGVMDEQAPHQE